MTAIPRWWRSPWLRYGLTVVLLALILWKADPRQFWQTGKSPMPSYQGQLSAVEVTDLVAYLSSLKEAK